MYRLINTVYVNGVTYFFLKFYALFIAHIERCWIKQKRMVVFYQNSITQIVFIRILG